MMKVICKNFARAFSRKVVSTALLTLAAMSLATMAFATFPPRRQGVALDPMAAHTAAETPIVHTAHVCSQLADSYGYPHATTRGLRLCVGLWSNKVGR
jgi:hypothetical protein